MIFRILSLYITDEHNLPQSRSTLDLPLQNDVCTFSQ